MRLDPIALEAGVRLLALGRVASTNQEARRQARFGAQGPLWITAETQTAGRGRIGRKWVSPPGNLYASLLLPEPSAVENASELAFVAALAVRDAVVAEAPALSARLSFKWPNDLLLGSEKCAGILIEGEVSNDGALGPGKRFVVVVGVGVNCARHPPAAPAAPAADPEAAAIRPPILAEEMASYPATDLAAHGAAVTPQRLFQRLSATMCRRLAAWDRGRGFPAILGDWLSAARGLGGEITVRTGGAEKRGRFLGLDQSGRLVLQVAGGRIEKISAGDVFPFELSDYRRLPRGAS